MSVFAVSPDSKTQNKQVLGLVAGEGSLPAILAESASERGFSVVCLALSRVAADAVRPHCTKVYEVFPGQVSKNLKIARAEGILEAVLIGKVPKLNVLQNITKLDWIAIKELSKVTSFSDDAIQQAIGRFLEQEGITVRSQAEFLRHLFPEVGMLTKRQPTAADYADIEFGLKIAKELARLDIGQTVVVRDRCVIAVEGSEGTDQAIRRGVELARKSVVVVKVARPGHDERFDMPAIGLNTLIAMKAPKPGGVLAIGAGETMVVDQEAVVQFADQNGIAIVVV
jgi:DUF1009 family protein